MHVIAIAIDPTYLITIVRHLQGRERLEEAASFRPE